MVATHGPKAWSCSLVSRVSCHGMTCSCTRLVRRLLKRRKTEELPLDAPVPDFIPSFLLCCIGTSHRKGLQSTEFDVDTEGRLGFRPGGVLEGRYKVISTIGEGTFGKVIQALDFITNKEVAIKIIKKDKRTRTAALCEVKVLKELAKADPYGERLCVMMLDHFDFRGHSCITFELLGPSVYDFLKQNNYQPYLLHDVRHIASQLCYAVSFLHELKLTHTDLKPENILFVKGEYRSSLSYAYSSKRREMKYIVNPDIKLIDFGNTTFDDEHHSKVITTRHYRAPEVILDLGWSQPCDVWSIGCILYELYTGKTLFQTHDDREHLAMMEKILGPIPFRMQAKTKTKFFRHGRLDWDDRRPGARYVRDHCKPLRRYIMCDTPQHRCFFDLLEQMLRYDPSERITTKRALDHWFFLQFKRQPQ